jgi:hypothetical protein
MKQDSVVGECDFAEDGEMRSEGLAEGGLGEVGI